MASSDRSGLFCSTHLTNLFKVGAVLDASLVDRISGVVDGLGSSRELALKSRDLGTHSILRTASSFELSLNRSIDEECRDP